MSEWIRLDFEEAQIIEGITGPLLEVSGTAPYAMEEYRIQPARVEIAPWEHWPYYPEGLKGDAAEEVLTPYTVTIDLKGDGAPRSADGSIEVVGADGRTKVLHP